MRIKKLQFKNLSQQWEIKEIVFFELTLLVGISGVGKTQILEAINTIKRIAYGNSLNGVEWKVEFESLSGINYEWSGKFEKLAKKSLIDDDSRLSFLKKNDKLPKPKIKQEYLYVDETLLAKRESGSIFFKNEKMPKLSTDESLLSIFKEESKIKPAYEAFDKIVYRDHTIPRLGLSYASRSIDKLSKEYTTLDKIRSSDLDTSEKLFCVYKNVPKVFNEIKDKFIDVFNQVIDIKIEYIRDDDLPSFLFEAPLIQIKEKNVRGWIPQTRMSSGMFRTLIHISELYLWDKGTVILIDEFENSLGVNCIDVLTEDLLFENDRIQFIATSHHPYIINKIPYEYWKIVTRKGGLIHTYDANKFNLGESSHERFMNLVNLPNYAEGIDFEAN